MPHRLTTLAGALLVLLPLTAGAFTLSPTGVTPLIEYTEPTTSTNGLPLTNLVATRIYWRIGTGPETAVSIPSSQATGGGAVSVGILVPILPCQQGTINVSVTAVDPSDALPESVFVVAPPLVVDRTKLPTGLPDPACQMTTVLTDLSVRCSACRAGLGPVTFDAPSPPGGSGALLGLYQGIDFANGWRWTPAVGVLLSNGIYFDSGTGTSRPFTFTPGPRRLASLTVVAFQAGTLTLTDDAGQSISKVLPQGAVVTFGTGWTKPSSVVTVTSSVGWSLVLDDLAYQ